MYSSWLNEDNSHNTHNGGEHSGNGRAMSLQWRRFHSLVAEKWTKNLS